MRLKPSVTPSSSGKSGRGLPRSKAWRRVALLPASRSVVAWGSPLPHFPSNGSQCPTLPTARGLFGNLDRRSIAGVVCWLPAARYVFSVAQICNLLYRRLAVGRTSIGGQLRNLNVLRDTGAAQIENLRYSRLKVCATPKTCPALERQRLLDKPQGPPSKKA